MKLKLKSDFRDYYDFMFDTTGEIFERMSTTDMSRSEMFLELWGIGLPTPMWGLVNHLSHNLPQETKLILYKNEYAHRGEGKAMTTLRDALCKERNTLASLYVPTLRPEQPVSYRYLRIGNLVPFWLRYQSDDEWRSNCGSNIEIIEVSPPSYLLSYRDKQSDPLLAIDFVHCLYGGFLAIDYNTSPGLDRTPICKQLTPTQVVGEIKSFLNSVPKKR